MIAYTMECVMSIFGVYSLKDKIYSKTCVKRPLSKRPQIGFQDILLIQVKSIAESSKGSILQYF